MTESECSKCGKVIKNDDDEYRKAERHWNKEHPIPALAKRGVVK